jgi:hypothetical protein
VRALVEHLEHDVVVSPRVIGRIRGQAGKGSVEDDRPNSVGIAGGEVRSQRGALRAAEDHRALHPGGVHHGPSIVDPLLDRRRACHRVGQPHPTLVVGGDASERRQATHESDVAGMLPGEVEVRDRAGDVDDVHRAVADDLVRDAQIATPRVPRRGTHG